MSYKRRFPSVKNLTINPSYKQDKRLVAIFTMNNRPHTIHFGLKNATTYSDNQSLTEKRRLYKARASKITNKGP